MKFETTVTSSPHISSKNTTQSIMLDVVIALIPAGIAGIRNFGEGAFSVIAVSVICCMLFEYIWNKVMHKPNSLNDFTAVITGLLLAYNLPPQLPLWIVAIGAFFSIIIVKQLFGGLGSNFVNPALAGRAFLLAGWAKNMTTWLSPSFFGLDSVSSATPLALIKSGNLDDLPLLSDVIIGNIGGCIGETSSLLLIIGGIYLIIRKVISYRTPAAFIATVAVLTFIFGGGKNPSEALTITIYSIFSGGLILGAFFMATDYTTSPVTAKGQVIMGIGCGIITTAIRLVGGYPEGVSYSILIMNIASPLIDRFTRPTPFGHKKKSKEAA